MNTFSHRHIRSRVSHQPPKSGKRLWHIVLVWLLICILGFVWYIRNTGNVLIPTKNYTISSHMNLSNLNETLELGVSPLRYRLYIKFFAPKVTLQAGSYELRDSTTLEAFLRDTLTHPLHVDRTIRILPGWNMWDIDEYLASQGIAETGGFLATAQINFAQYQDEFAFLSGVSSLEWFLYPDTYRISPSATADTVIRVMLREFQKKIGDAYVDMDPRKAYEALILSSIVEREEPLDANQPIVAGILAKRVHEGIAMGADATVCY